MRSSRARHSVGWFNAGSALILNADAVTTPNQCRVNQNMSPHMKIKMSAELIALCDEYVKEWSAALEEKIIAVFNKHLSDAGYAVFYDAFVEEGSREHNVVDIFAFDGQQITRLDPNTGEAVAL